MNSRTNRIQKEALKLWCFWNAWGHRDLPFQSFCEFWKSLSSMLTKTNTDHRSNHFMGKGLGVELNCRTAMECWCRWHSVRNGLRLGRSGLVSHRLGHLPRAVSAPVPARFQSLPHFTQSHASLSKGAATPTSASDVRANGLKERKRSKISQNSLVSSFNAFAYIY